MHRGNNGRYITKSVHKNKGIIKVGIIIIILVIVSAVAGLTVSKPTAYKATAEIDDRDNIQKVVDHLAEAYRQVDADTQIRDRAAETLAKAEAQVASSTAHLNRAIEAANLYMR